VWKPCRASSRAVTSPMPVFAPVTIATGAEVWVESLIVFPSLVVEHAARGRFVARKSAPGGILHDFPSGFCAE
jgi:hypothetical protein